jgi:sphingolipid delta-4 desaturase
LWQGVDGWDVDLPTCLEANWITTFGAKVCWVFVYILVYGLRPVIIRPKAVGEPFSHLLRPACQQFWI